MDWERVPKYGRYTRTLTDDYSVLDLETTGFSPVRDKIIEIGIIKVRGGEAVDSYERLVFPGIEVDGFIENLTGITNEMLEGCPYIDGVIEEAWSFIGDDPVLGHCTSFDLRFMAANLGRPIDNCYMDTCSLAKSAFPGLPHYRLSDIKKLLGIHTVSHRALSDCEATMEVYETIKRDKLL
jgi:DNA polymerase-3 subunit epsilon